MAKRSREHRQDIPGYDESRPTREQRKLQHRAARHATHQILHTVADPDEVVLPEERRTRRHENGRTPQEPEKRRFKVWKTKFWKRRDNYRDLKAEIDANWPVIPPERIEQIEQRG